MSSDLRSLVRIKQRQVRKSFDRRGRTPATFPSCQLHPPCRACRVTGEHQGPLGQAPGEDPGGESPSSSLARSQSRPPGRAKTQEAGRGHFWACRCHPSLCGVMVGRGCCGRLFRLLTAQAWRDSGSGELELQSPNLFSLFKSSSKPGIQVSKLTRQTAPAMSRTPSQRLLGPTGPKASRFAQESWRWGPEGYGAILLVNCDRDSLRSTGMDLTNTQLASQDGEQQTGRAARDGAWGSAGLSHGDHTLQTCRTCPQWC